MEYQKKNGKKYIINIKINLIYGMVKNNMNIIKKYIILLLISFPIVLIAELISTTFLSGLIAGIIVEAISNAIFKEN